MFFLISAFKIIFLLGFLIAIHETGHFLVAKLCGVRVNEFAIGFGPEIFHKDGIIYKGYSKWDGEPITNYIVYSNNQIKNKKKLYFNKEI